MRRENTKTDHKLKKKSGDPLVADFFFFFCYARDFMMSLANKNQTAFIEAFNSTSS